MFIFSYITDFFKGIFTKIKDLLSKYIKKDELKQDLKDMVNDKIDQFIKTDDTNSCEDKYEDSYQEDKPDCDKEEAYLATHESVDKSESSNISSALNAREKLFKDLDLIAVTTPIIKGESERSILVLDDVDMMYNLYMGDFRKIKRNNNADVMADFKIVLSTGYDCGYKAYKYIELGNKIDYGILDITLGCVMKTRSGEHVEIDGIDIAIQILKQNPDFKFKFVSAHTLNRHNHTMLYYFNKFEQSTGLNIEEYYVNKNGNRAEELYKLLYNIG